MNKNIFYLIMIVFFLPYGCKNKSIKNDPEETTSIQFDIQRELKSIHDIGLIKDVEIISLDCEEVIIGNIDEVVKFDTIIYLMDKTQNMSIYIFNLEGGLIHSISNFGNGPAEYIQLTDMFVDPADSSLNIVSRIDKKLFKYDLKGEELRTIGKNPKSFTSMRKMDKGYLAYMGNYSEDRTKPYNLWLLNENLKTVDHYFEIDKIWEGQYSTDGAVFSAYKNMYYYITPRDYNIYVIENNKLTTKYNFNFGKWSLPKINETDVVNEKRLFELKNEYIYRFYNFQETENHLIVKLLHKGRYLLGVYNKNNKQANIVTLDPYEGKYFLVLYEILWVIEF
ncbi:6-bladed beta-propeller [Proteiniphilum sp. X52]|uniref:6-bladed beta-propeller n=1 Tax=Proteiniphilum sp. X52 TaxID=2382159 RepID=UPI000F0A6863|nr:6-bladed beta-propeller [Proteiniphilum sp. X52]RNC63308.1 6-bladed beta-propeller [Proteiniphilum sp. X52]